MKTTAYISAVVIAAALVSSCCCNEDLTKYADPFVGTAYTGHTFPGPAYPFGFVQPGPNSGNCDWEHCSGYNNDDEFILGFAQNHINGTGCPDLGDIMLFPWSDSVPAEYKSHKANEDARPGYYCVELTESNVFAEMTCSEHATIHRYTFNGEGKNLYIDLQTAQVGSDYDYNTHVLEAEINEESDYVISGHEHVKGWVNRELYFVIEFSQPVATKDTIVTDPRNKGPKYLLSFEQNDQPLYIKVGISTVSVDGAKANLAAEIPAWDFEGVYKSNKAAWNKLFKNVSVKGNADQKANFYTSLYHLYIQPNNIADVDGQYRGADNNVYTSATGKYYSTLSLWDTFRASHPFYTLFNTQREIEMVNSMLEHCDAQGFLPIWQLWGKENYCMIGNHGVPVVVEAALKELPGVDAERVYAAVKKSLTEEHYRGEWRMYDQYGYFPCDLIKEESASRTLECGLDDYCAAQLAKKLGYEEDYEFFTKRANYWKNLFDDENKLIRGRLSDGSWRTPFNKFHLSHGGTAGGDYTEGNAWQYTWHIQHDLDGLVEKMGGVEATVVKLDSLFTIETRADQTGWVGDVTGLIGQYAQGNEPSHHVIYFYTLLDRQDRAAELIRDVFNKFYLNKPDGLCGNDDCGQMSAWYMFSAMGFYPVNTVSGEYVLGAPQVPEVTIKLENGKKFTMVTHNLSEENLYVASAKFNGQPLDKIITYDQIIGGGKLEFEMTNNK